MMHGSSDINSNRQIFFFVILGQFSLFYHHNSPKDKNIKQMKQKHLEIWSFSTSVPKMIIIGYTVPDIWHVTDVIVIFHFGLLFALLLPQQPKKWKFKKKLKLHLEILSFYTSVPKIKLICYTVSEIWHVTDKIVIFHNFLTPLTAQKWKFQKIKKKEHLDILSFYTILQKLSL